MCLGAIGDVFKNEADHIGQLTNSISKNPLQAFIGAEDPVGAKLWGGLTGQNFTPQVNVLGGETNTQFRTSQSRGINTTPSRDLGYVADAIAVYEAGSYAYDSAGLGAAGEAAAGGDAAAGAGGAGGAGASTLPADVSVGTTGAGGTTATAGGAGASGAASTTPGWVSGLETVGKAVAPAVVSSLLAPKPPKTKAPTAMPDPLAQQQAYQQKLITQLARRGRASTILTNPANSGGDALG